MERTYHKDGSAPQAGRVFVFGSNLSGFHVGGAAKAAHELYGAEWGIDFGPTGNCFAIPTVGALMRPLSLDDIRKNVEAFILYATEVPEQQYFVTRIGCGIAGNKDEDVAPLFADAPLNCSLPDTWRRLLEPDHSDDPNHVIDEQPSADLRDEGWSDRRYRGNLVEDRKAVSLRSQLLQITSDAVFLAQLDQDFRQVFGDGKRDDAKRERECNGFYSMQAAGRDR
jgi:hypothetical protein